MDSSGSPLPPRGIGCYLCDTSRSPDHAVNSDTERPRSAQGVRAALSTGGAAVPTGRGLFSPWQCPQPSSSGPSPVPPPPRGLWPRGPALLHLCRIWRPPAASSFSRANANPHAGFWHPWPLPSLRPRLQQQPPDGAELETLQFYTRKLDSRLDFE